jgi:hypothetical protein
MKALFTPYAPPFRYCASGQQIFDANGELYADMRGWGWLTGKGGLAMEDVKAAKLQDGLGSKTADILNVACNGFESSASVVITHNENEYEETPVKLSMEDGRICAEPLDAHYGLLESPNGDDLADTINRLLARGVLSGAVGNGDNLNGVGYSTVPFYVKFTN